MARMMQNMASSSDNYEDYDYDYGYDYDDQLDDYDYDYDYEGGVDESAPSPMMSMIQKMLQQKLAARQATVQVSLTPIPEPENVAAPSAVDFQDSGASPSIEIAQPVRPRSDKEMRTPEEVSYRSAP